jgi:hypothetical protein
VRSRTSTLKRSFSMRLNIQTRMEIRANSFRLLSKSSYHYMQHTRNYLYFQYRAADGIVLKLFVLFWDCLLVRFSVCPHIWAHLNLKSKNWRKSGHTLYHNRSHRAMMGRGKKEKQAHLATMSTIVTWCSVKSIPRNSINRAFRRHYSHLSHKWT